jgi:hypothetical protein
LLFVSFLTHTLNSTPRFLLAIAAVASVELGRDLRMDAVAEAAAVPTPEISHQLVTCGFSLAIESYAVILFEGKPTTFS